MQIDQLTYIKLKLKKITFKDIKLIKSAIMFAKSNQYAILRLNQSKTGVDQIEVEIILVATGKPTCPVSAL